MSVRWTPRAAGPLQLDAVRVLAPVRHVGHEVEAERAARREHARHRVERRREIAIGEQRLQHAVRRDDGVEGAPGERQAANVAADERRRVASRRRRRPASARVEHFGRTIDADERNAGLDERHRDAPGAAAELEHRALGVERDAAPERHVATAERSRVLPVVERRVLVPALPALARGLLRHRRHS